MIAAIPLSRLARATHGAMLGADVHFTGIAIDSRAVAAGDLFVAIPGARVDGHDFVRAAAAHGATAMLVQADVEQAGGPTLKVEDTVRALGVLGQLIRDDYEGVLVGVTGSAGKTTAKNMIAAVLAEAGPTVATEGNRNNEIGLPLTLAELDANTEFAVVEMGAAKPDDIAYLCEIARPNVSVLLNAGSAHLEAYRDEAQLADTKSQIIDGLDADELAVINGDQTWTPGWIDRAAPARCVTFGTSEGVDYRATQITLGGFSGADFDLVTRRGVRRIHTSIPGMPGVYNALAAIAVGSELGLGDKAIDRGLAKVRAQAGRGSVLAGRDGATVVDDTYNANPEAVRAGLALLGQAGGRRVLILGAMAELGPRSAELHQGVGALAAELGVNQLITVGEAAIPAHDAFSGDATHYADSAALIDALPTFGAGTTVLVKGSRSIGLERVVDALCPPEEGIAC